MTQIDEWDRVSVFISIVSGGALHCAHLIQEPWTDKQHSQKKWQPLWMSSYLCNWSKSQGRLVHPTERVDTAWSGLDFPSGTNPTVAITSLISSLVHPWALMFSPSKTYSIQDKYKPAPPEYWPGQTQYTLGWYQGFHEPRCWQWISLDAWQ